MDSETSLEEVIATIGDCAVERDYETLFLILDELNFEEPDLIAMYYFCVELLTKTGDGPTIPLFSDYFIERSGYGSIVQFLLFARHAEKVDVLEFFYQSNGLTAQEYFDLFVQVPREQDMRQGFAALLSVLEGAPEVTLELFSKTLGLAEVGDVPLLPVVRELLVEQIAARRPRSDVPVHVLEGEELSTQDEMLARFQPPTHQFPQFARDLRKEACLFYAEKLYHLGDISRPEIAMKAQEIEDKLLKSFEGDNGFEELNNFIDAYKTEHGQVLLQKDTELFRILGPCHPTDGVWELDPEGRYICQRYGGCRMMTCVEHEDDDDEIGLRFEQPQLFDWFTGKCDLCLREIEKKHYAVRALMEQGGFIGCFCSPEHALSSLCSDSIAYALTRKALNELMSTGIYDRLDEEPNVETREQMLATATEFLDFLREDSEDFDF